MAKYNLNMTGSKVSTLLQKIDSSEIFTKDEKDKLQSLDSNGSITQSELNEALETLKAEVSKPVYEVTLAIPKSFSGSGFIRPVGTISEGGTYGYTDYIKVSDCTTVTINVCVRAASVSPVVWYDADKNYIKGETGATNTTIQTYVYSVPENAVYARFSSYTQFIEPSVTAISTNKNDDILSSKSKKVYLSVNGDDANDGLTIDTPIATFNHAKEILDPDGELVLLEGDYFNFAVDLGAFARLTGHGNVRLIYYAHIFNAPSLVDGFSRVYKASCAETFTTPIWQHDVADARTEILFEEKHTLHRGKTHRLPSTRIVSVTTVDSTSTTLDGYLATMEATVDNYLYYTDGTNIYFTAPNTDFSTYPVIKGTKNLVKADTENNNVYIRGLNVLYAQFKTTGLKGTVEEVSVLGGYAAGCIVWDNTFNLTFIRCEVAGSDRDGINGHTSGNVTCFDCWMHDCLDDGESAHENCTVTHYGGLAEYNVNACTPASNASGTYYNVLARHCSNRGFSASGGTSAIVCNGCVSLDTRVGFLATTGTSATFINCATDCGYSGSDASMSKFNCADLQ